MKQLTRMIAAIKGFSKAYQLKEYLQTGSIMYNFRGAIMMKQLDSRFVWYSSQPIDR